MTINKHILKNGLQVILEENHSRPVISFNVLVNVGSCLEKDSEAGMSHVIEHMLFKGTPKMAVGAIAKEVEAAGGEINAYTSLDQTVYYINMASLFADKGLEILADAIINPLFDSKELESEKEVILEEVRRENDNPGRMAAEILFNTAYKHHTYGRPIIGFPKTVKSFTRSQLIKFYKKWYVPSNTALVIVGDFKSVQMLEKVKKVFASYKGKPIPKKSLEIIKEPDQLTPRIKIQKMNVQSAYLNMGYHIPNITHNDVPCIDILAHILGGAESSRLEQSIKEKKHLVHHISSYSYTPKHPGLFAISAVLKESNISEAIKAINSEIHKIQMELVSTSELSRAKINIRSNEIYERETVGGEGGKITSFLAATNDHDFEKKYYQSLMNTNANAIKEATRKYLIPNNCTITLIIPKNADITKNKKKLLSLFKTEKKYKKTNTKKQSNKPEIYELKNNLKVIIQQNHNLPITAICATTLGGLRFETFKNNGISELATRLFTKGTKNRNAVTITHDIEKMAGYIDGFSGRNTIGVKSKFLSEHTRNGIELFSDILTNPSFDENEFRKEQSHQLHAIKDQEDALASISFRNFLKTLFPQHPYGLSALGTHKSVSKLKPSDIKKYYKQIIKRSGTVISIVGDVNPDETLKLLEKNLNNLQKGKQSHPKIRIDPRPTHIRTSEILKKDKQQAHIVLGFQTCSLNDKDKYALSVFNNILIGQGGRLFLELRDKMSLAYSVSSTHIEGIDPGFLAVYIGTEPKKINKAINGIKNELEKIRTKLVTGDELKRSKQYLVGTYELESQRLMTMASWLAFNELYGLGLAEIERYPKTIMKISRQDVLRVAQKYINLDAYVLSIVRPE